MLISCVVSPSSLFLKCSCNVCSVCAGQEISHRDRLATMSWYTQQPSTCVVPDTEYSYIDDTNVGDDGRNKDSNQVYMNTDNDEQPEPEPTINSPQPIAIANEPEPPIQRLPSAVVRNSNSTAVSTTVVNPDPAFVTPPRAHARAALDSVPSSRTAPIAIEVPRTDLNNMLVRQDVDQQECSIDSGTVVKNAASRRVSGSEVQLENKLTTAEVKVEHKLMDEDSRSSSAILTGATKQRKRTAEGLKPSDTQGNRLAKAAKKDQKKKKQVVTVDVS